MKLLIVTQVVDKQHSVLGFFHRWIEEFSKQCEKVTVICLEQGDYNLPGVTVFSLGKEAKNSKLKQLTNFYHFIWQQRNEYDTVFVHMNPLYVVLGGLFWRIRNNKVGLWYTHGTVSVMLRVATLLTNKVFTASEESFRISTKKKIVTGHGIDTDVFKPLLEEKTIDLITVGRISPAKNIEQLLEVLSEVRKRHPTTLTVVGSAIDEKGEEYETFLREKCKALGIEEPVTFYGPISQAGLPRLLNQAKVFVTASQTGSLDKVVLEAMACGLSVVSSAPGTTSLELGDGQVESKESFTLQILERLNQADTNDNEKSNQKAEKNVIYIKKNHSLSNLVSNIISIY